MADRPFWTRGNVVYELMIYIEGQEYLFPNEDR